MPNALQGAPTQPTRAGTARSGSARTLTSINNRQHKE
jgi:hypothetical protein